MNLYSFLSFQIRRQKLGNYAQKGIIKISKSGEVFATVTEADGMYQPVYEVQGLAGATYEIKAAEDVYTLDGTEPVFKDNLLVYGGRYYLIGEGHKEFLADKTKDIDYYVLALAGIARELNIRKITSGKVHIAAGLPLTWVSGQRNEFKDYLMQNREVEFTFRGTQYHVEIIGADVFPQGFAAVADRLSEFKGVNMLCDIGNGTMNIMFINDKKPIPGNMFTEKYGTHQRFKSLHQLTQGRKRRILLNVWRH